MDEPNKNSTIPPNDNNGKTLGGERPGGAILTLEDVRRQRLKRLEARTTTTIGSSATEPLPTADASFSSSNLKSKVKDPPELVQRAPPSQQLLHDDEELQVALALSMQAVDAGSEQTEEDDTPERQLAGALQFSKETSQDNHGSEDGSSSLDGIEINPLLPSSPSFPAQEQIILEDISRWYDVSSEATCVLDFHGCMWDESITTHNDRLRWLSQDVRFKEVVWKMEHTDNLMTSIIGNPHLWGLTQTHGGPCGVLASIQAELLRLLLFGTRSPSNNPRSDYIPWEYPTHNLSTVKDTLVEGQSDLSPELLKQGLSMSMAMILARAAMMPPADLQDNKSDDTMVADEHGISVNAHYQHRSTPTVQVVLPIHQHSALEWHHLKPWTNVDDVDVRSGRSEHLVTYKIRLREDESTTSNTHGECYEQHKRPKRDKIWSQLNSLAQATAHFLFRYLEFYQKPGGALLYIISLVLTRQIPRLRADMDDRCSKLTTNFGHCSQELINLLLTGQAVSNVFDNTLRPSGDYVCRGIQSRPAIGYLTQLEAMRYLEVGGYYKTPQFPIWVVGSTSHFTVMFGDATCLQESQSDKVLERVRRAFKAMDGGAEENGFLQIHQLKQFLEKLGLVGTGKVISSDHSIHTLSATMEVHGAGIILWEDLWKQTSRLLTGASLESVLDGSNSTTSPIDTQTVMPSTPRSSTTTEALQPLTDEEFARRLQAELNGESYDAEMTPHSSVSSAVASQNNSNKKETYRHRKETYGHTYQLYHYNGLRGSNFKAFRVTRLCADEAIGSSVSLVASSQSSAALLGASGDMEEVLRTKWPSCKIDWLGGSSPSIN